MKPSFVAALAVVVALFAGQSVQEARAEAQAYPARPITFIATEVAGSATDIQVRIIAGGMAALLGQPIEVENIFGEPGLEKAIRAAPDGYTLVYGGTGTLALLPHIKKVSFDPLHDLAPAGRFVISPTLLAVNPALPANNVQELVALMKAEPGKLRMSTAGAGTTGHFAGELFIAMAGVKPVVVHYPGGGPAIDAVVSNDSQWTMAPIAGRLPHVRSGRLRALATGGATRLPVLPDVPTIAESGYPDYNSVGWASIYVPNGTPQPVVERLNAAIAAAVALPEVKRAFAEQGVEGVSGTPAEAAKLLADDYARLGELARRIGVRVE
jgi:tripartite-type tricarboxylate transporter receptor subunit TctC